MPSVLLVSQPARPLKPHRGTNVARALALTALALGLSVIHEAQAASTNSWATTGSLNTARDSHTATLLPNGMVLVAGGYGSSGNPLATAELYNPANGT
jgi:hypothetical protein